MHKSHALKFTPLTSSPHTTPSLYHQTVQTQGWHFGVRNRRMQINWHHNQRQRGTAGLRRPSPLSWFCSCIFFATIQKQLAQIRPMGRENRPMCSEQLSLKQPSAEESKEGDTGYGTCSSRRIGHEGPDVPLTNSGCMHMLQYNALQHIPTFPCFQLVILRHGGLIYVMWSRGRL